MAWSWKPLEMVRYFLGLLTTKFRETVTGRNHSFSTTSRAILKRMFSTPHREHTLPLALLAPNSGPEQWESDSCAPYGLAENPLLQVIVEAILPYGRSSVEGIDELSKKEMMTKYSFATGYLLDQQNPESKKILIITSYETQGSDLDDPSVTRWRYPQPVGTTSKDNNSPLWKVWIACGRWGQQIQEHGHFYGRYLLPQLLCSTLWE